MPIHVEVITPEGVALEEEGAEHVLLSAAGGELGILPGHIPMFCSVAIGPLTIDKKGETIEMATSGGFAELNSDHLMILAETAEKAEEIDVERAQKALERARERLHRAEDVDRARLTSALARARTRLHVAGQDIEAPRPGAGGGTTP